MAEKIAVFLLGSTEAKLFHASTPDNLEEVAYFTHPESRLHGRDLMADKPGRAFESSSPTRHAMAYPTPPQKVESEAFAMEMAKMLEKRLKHYDFSRLYIAATPEMLGLLRGRLAEMVQKTVVAEVDKNLLNKDKGGILAALPRLSFL